MLQVNVPDVPSSTRNVVLGGRTYTISFKYMTRGDYWVMSLFRGKDPVLINQKCVEGFVTGSYQTPLFDSGNLFIVRYNEGESDRPRRNNFGIDKEFSLLYVSYAELV